MQVSFWSNYHQLGTTSNMVAIALFIALKYRLRILIAHNHFDRSTLESSFMDKSYIKHSLMDFSDTGIDALSRFIKFNKIGKDEISSYTTTILKNRLDLLIGTTITNKDIYQNSLKESIQLILQSAALYYDLVLIDTASGNNEVSKKIIDNSNLVVVNLSQNPNTIDNFLSNYSHYKEKALVLLGKYDANSRFNIKRIKRRYNLNHIHAIPYNIEFADACIESRAVDFFIKNLESDKNDIHNNFITGVEQAAQVILNILGIDESKMAWQVN